MRAYSEMKSRILYFTLLLLSTLLPGNSSAQSSFESEFPLPVVPEEIGSYAEQAEYMVTHFWDRVKLNTAINNRDGFARAFATYISQMPLASNDVIQESLSKLVKSFEKDPKGLLSLALIAEDALYSDNALLYSDEIYLPFVKAVVKSKKISGADKARFQRQAKIIEGNMVGHAVPDLKFRTIDGKSHTLSEYKGRYIILFVNDPDCEDCRIARLRLSTDSSINSFIDDGKLYFISIYPDEINDEWIASVSNYNKRWVVGASVEADEVLDLRATPTIYYINQMGDILSKSITPEQLIEGFNRIHKK